MEKVFDLLKEIEINPCRYLRSESITLLDSFLGGYLFGLKVIGTNEMIIFFEFHRYVAVKYNIRSSHSWREIFLFFERGEKKAFRKFFEIFWEYVEEKYA